MMQSISTTAIFVTTLHNQILFYLCVVYNYGNIVQFCCNFCAHDECVKLDLNCIMTNCIEKQFREIKTKDRKSILCVPLYLYIFIQYMCVHRIQQISLSHTAKSMPTVKYQLHCFSRQRKPLDLFHCFSEIFEHPIFDVLSLMRGYWGKSTAIWHAKMS